MASAKPSTAKDKPTLLLPVVHTIAMITQNARDTRWSVTVCGGFQGLPLYVAGNETSKKRTADQDTIAHAIFIGLLCFHRQA